MELENDSAQGVSASASHNVFIAHTERDKARVRKIRRSILQIADTRKLRSHEPRPSVYFDESAFNPSRDQTLEGFATAAKNADVLVVVIPDEGLHPKSFVRKEMLAFLTGICHANRGDDEPELLTSEQTSQAKKKQRKLVIVDHSDSLSWEAGRKGVRGLTPLFDAGGLLAWVLDAERPRLGPSSCGPRFVAAAALAALWGDSVENVRSLIEEHRRRILMAMLVAVSLVAMLLLGLVVMLVRTQQELGTTNEQLSTTNTRLSERNAELNAESALENGHARSAIAALVSIGPTYSPWYRELGNTALQLPRAVWRDSSVVLAHHTEERAYVLAGEHDQLLRLPDFESTSIRVRGDGPITRPVDWDNAEHRARHFDSERYNVGEVSQLVFHPSTFRAAAIHPKGTVTVCETRRICLYGEQGEVRTTATLPGNALHVMWSPEGDVLAMAMTPKGLAAFLWTGFGSPEHLGEAYSGLILDTDWLRSIVIMHDLNLVSGDDQRKLGVFHLTDFPFRNFEDYNSPFATSLHAESPFVRARLHGNRIGAVHESGDITLSPVPPLGNDPSSPSQAVKIANHEGANDLMFSSDGARLITVGRRGARIWEEQASRSGVLQWESQQLLRHVDGTVQGERLDVVYGALHGTRATTVDELGRTWLWDAGELLERLPSPGGPLRYAAQDGEFVVVSSDSGTAFYRIPNARPVPPPRWMMDSEAAVRGSNRRSFAGIDGIRDIDGVNQFALDAEGNCVIAYGPELLLYRWDGEAYRASESLAWAGSEPFSPEHAALTCNEGLHLALAVSDVGVEVLGPDGWRVLPEVREEIHDVAISRDGSRVAIASGTNVVVHSRNGEALSLTGHLGQVDEVTFETPNVLWSRGAEGWRKWLLDPFALHEALRSADESSRPAPPSR